MGTDSSQARAILVRTSIGMGSETSIMEEGLCLELREREM